MGLEILPGEWEVHIGHPSPGFWLWEDESFYVAYTSGTNKRAEETNFTCEEHTHFLTPRARGRKQIETAQGSRWFLTTILPCSPACTGCLLQSLLPYCCTIPGQRCCFWKTEGCAYRGKRRQLSTSQGERHPQKPILLVPWTSSL